MLGIYVICILLLLDGIYTQDPAPGWMGYAKASGNGTLLTYMEAKWKVPHNPTEGGLFFGIWFGIEPDPALNLIQPVLPWIGDHWEIYNEYFQWKPVHNYDSNSHTVRPGDTIFGFVKYNPGNNSYTMFNSVLNGWSVTSEIPIQKDSNGDYKIYTDAYIVFEKTSRYCAQYPPDGIVTFYDIRIDYNNQKVIPDWSTHVKDDYCNNRAHIVNSTTITLTWNTS